MVEGRTTCSVHVERKKRGEKIVNDPKLFSRESSKSNKKKKILAPVWSTDTHTHKKKKKKINKSLLGLFPLLQQGLVLPK